MALLEPLVHELRAHLIGFVDKGAGAHIFTSSDGQPIEQNNFHKRVWMPAIRTGGLRRLRFQDLRHTAGTLAARTGATTKELMALLGHSSSNAALNCQHASAERGHSIADGLSVMFWEAQEDALS